MAYIICMLELGSKSVQAGGPRAPVPEQFPVYMYKNARLASAHQLRATASMKTTSLYKLFGICLEDPLGL